MMPKILTSIDTLMGALVLRVRSLEEVLTGLLVSLHPCLFGLLPHLVELELKLPLPFIVLE